MRAVLLLLLAAYASGQCVSYTGNVFSGIIPASGYPVHIPVGSSLRSIERQATQSSILLAELSPSCRLAKARLLASHFFPACNPSPTPVAPCQALCTDVSTTCASSADQAVLARFTTFTSTVGTSDQCTSSSPCGALGGSGTVVPLPKCEVLNTTILPVTPKLYPVNFVAEVLPAGYKTFVPAGHTQTTLFNSLPNVQVVLDGIASSACRDQFAGLVAAAHFQACDTIANPRAPCRAVCTETESVCTGKDLAWINTVYFAGLRKLDASLPSMTLASYCTGHGQVLDGAADNFPVAAGLAPNLNCASLPTAAPMEAPQGHCEVYTGATCAGVTSGSVYYPPGKCLQDLEDSIAQLPLTTGTVSEQCGRALTAYVCHKTYRPCDNSSAAAYITAAGGDASQFNGIALPKFTERKVCADVQDSCTGSLVLTVMSAAGAYPDFSKEVFKATIVIGDDDSANVLLLGGNAGSGCTTLKSSTPLSTPDWPQTNAITPVVNVTMDFGAGIKYVALSTPTAVAPDISAMPVLTSKCVPFSTEEILRTTPPAFPPGVRTIEPLTDTIISYCTNVIPEGTPVFMPAGMTLGLLNAATRQGAWTTGILPTQTGCNSAWMRFLCSQVFMPCSTTVATQAIPPLGNGPSNITLPLPFPSFPCRSLCYDVIDKCASFIEATPSFAPNCTQAVNAPSGKNAWEKKQLSCDGKTILAPGQPDFPEDGESTWFQDIKTEAKNGVQGLNMVAETQCNAMYRAPAASALQLSCPWPLVNSLDKDAYGRPGTDFSENNINGGLCSMSCPSPIIRRELDDLVTMVMWGFEIAGTIFLTVQTVSWWVLPEKRKNINLVGFLTGITITYWHYLFIHRPDRFQDSCRNIAEATHLSDGVNSCTSFLVLGSFCGFLALGFSFCLCIDLYIAVFISKGKWMDAKKRKVQTGMAICVLSYCVTALICVLATQSLAGNIAGTDCAPGVEWVNWTFNITPMLLEFAVGGPLIGSVLVYSIKTSRSALKDAKDVMQRNLRPLIFCCIVWFGLLFLSAYAIYMSARGPAVTEAFTEWMTCFIGTQPYFIYVLGDYSYECPVRPSAEFSDWSQWMRVPYAMIGVAIGFSHGFPLADWKKQCRSWKRRLNGEGEDGSVNSQAPSKLTRVASSPALKYDTSGKPVPLSPQHRRFTTRDLGISPSRTGSGKFAFSAISKSPDAGASRGATSDMSATVTSSPKMTMETPKSAHHSAEITPPAADAEMVTLLPIAEQDSAESARGHERETARGRAKADVSVPGMVTKESNDDD